MVRHIFCPWRLYHIHFTYVAELLKVAVFRRGPCAEVETNVERFDMRHVETHEIQAVGSVIQGHQLINERTRPVLIRGLRFVVFSVLDILPNTPFLFQRDRF